MKFSLKNISLILVVVLSIGLLAGCTPQESTQNNEGIFEDLTLTTGFTNSKSEEDGKNFIVIDARDQDLKLEVVDEDLFASLEEDEFYIFAYNDENILRNIQKDLDLKDLVENSEEDGNNHPVLQEIAAGDKISMDGLTLLDEYIIDFNGDGHDEVIAMYVAAERDDNGEIMWDDGQRWVFVVHGDNKDYVLYDDYVQLGSIQFNVFTSNDEFSIVTKSVRTASLDISEYRYDETNDSFIQTIPYSVSGNVNMLHSSK
ncbi:MAG: hypothetical protein GX053_13600 [Tissierella sp.]|nr:hypothetical protein [Tissierella sp.]